MIEHVGSDDFLAAHGWPKREGGIPVRNIRIREIRIRNIRIREIRIRASL
jgi:hypothetical protein